jgi:hypothetical protein
MHGIALPGSKMAVSFAAQRSTARVAVRSARPSVARTSMVVNASAEKKVQTRAAAVALQPEKQLSAA